MFYVYNIATGIHAVSIPIKLNSRVRLLDYKNAAPACVETHISEGAAYNSCVCMNAHSERNGLSDRYAYVEG
jgi:hypothetical protein